mgnify:CR=1 FL=1
MRGQTHVRRFGLRLAVCWLAVVACRTEGGTRPPADLPPAEVYEAPPDFTGAWMGEVESTTGTLRIESLGDGRLYGTYKVEGVDVRYVLALQQTMQAGGDEELPTNRCTFTWQDGRGGRGTGWLLINRESSALTGAFGEGGDHNGGMWSFIRKE